MKKTRTSRQERLHNFGFHTCCDCHIVKPWTRVYFYPNGKRFAYRCIVCDLARRSVYYREKKRKLYQMVARPLERKTA